MFLFNLRGQGLGSLSSSEKYRQLKPEEALVTINVAKISSSGFCLISLI
jgi:hypothetical protein